MNNIFKTFEFIIGDKARVFSFKNLEKQGSSQKKDAICFERLATGMFFGSLINNESPFNQIEVNMLKPLTYVFSQLYSVDHQKNVDAALQQIQVRGQSSHKNCNISHLVRKGKGKVQNGIPDLQFYRIHLQKKQFLN